MGFGFHYRSSMYEMGCPCCTALPLFCFPGNYRNCLLYMKNLQVFSALEDNTICNFFSLERVTVHSAKDCFFPKRTFPRPPKPRLQWKSPQMSMDQYGDSKQKREVWDLYGSTAALIFPTHLCFSTQPKTLCTSVCSLALVLGMFLSTCISAFLSFHILPFLSAGDCISPAVGQLV